jgi:hypothetical protein
MATSSRLYVFSKTPHSAVRPQRVLGSSMSRLPTKPEARYISMNPSQCGRLWIPEDPSLRRRAFRRTIS